MSQAFLPYGRQQIDAEDERLVLEALRSDFLTTGPMVQRIERRFTEITGAQRAVVCANGTAGLHLAALALNWGPGDAVIVPTLTFLSTANCVTYVGAEPIFADVDPQTGLMRPEDLDAALFRARGKRIRAVIPVHLGGQCCDMQALSDICRARKLDLVEDACHAVGGTIVDADGKQVPVGACDRSTAAVFSFHPVKTATMGEGGIVTTNDARLADAMAEFRNHGMIRDPDRWRAREQGFTDGAPNPWYYEMHAPGFNYRATDLQCALGISQLAKLSRFVARRAELVARYDRALALLAPIVRPTVRMSGQKPGWHLYVVLIDFASAGTTRAKVMRSLAASGIGTQVHYLPVHLQPYYRSKNPDLELPGACAYYARCLSLPLHAGLGDGDVDLVVAALAAALGLGGKAP